ncbi:3-oxo-5-alpha-steroid 4-dehydrogenase [Minicystis rosea]|nr:3-oxo-5-alpha-steroid 4-dehydrogenase [Minicystis rosea]
MERQIYDVLIRITFAVAAVMFVSLFFVQAPYGRYARTGWGPQFSARAAWVIQELPSVLSFAIFFFLGEHALAPVPLVLFAMWQIHYLQRTFVFPFLLRGNKKNATTGVVALAILFTSLNGYLNGRWLSHYARLYETAYLLDPRFIVGALMFFAGLAINLHSDHVLRHLRKDGDAGYKIPVGGLFGYVSCANYFGEILEWTGWAVATWSPAGLCFAVWTFANLAPRALAYHKWYRQHFTEYPKDRRAVIPFLI